MNASALSGSLLAQTPVVVDPGDRPFHHPPTGIRMDWSEMFEIEVFPVVTAEQGLEMARQAMS
jgi:hypothetical protein